jgi:uncharacterized membrane protein
VSTVVAPARIRLAAAASSPVRERLHGIDLARALAVVGMVMVHVGPIRDEGGGLVGAAYRAPHGRAAILFIVVAGIGISLLAGDRGPERLRGTTARLAWTALLLLPAGLALQELPMNVAVILHYYAFFFLMAIMALRLPDRLLLALAAVSALLGPIAVLLAHRRWPGWFAGIPEWNEAGHIARDIVVSGTYPAVVWAAPLLVGIWVGRLELRSSAVARRLAAGGALLAASAFGAQRLFGAWHGAPTSETDWRQLGALEPHNEMPLWILQSTGIAVCAVGCCLLVAGALPRLVWPAVALGQLALTVYVVHILVLSVRPEWLERDTFDAAWVSIGRFVLVVLVLATAWRLVASRGPFEALLRLPWLLGQRAPREALPAQSLPRDRVSPG